MGDLHSRGLFEHRPPHVDPEIFQRLAPTLEGLRHALLALSKGEGHPFRHLPPGHEVEAQVRSQARSLRREAEILVVAGIGGSSLGTKVLCSRPGGKVRFLEGVDPETLSSRLAEIPWKRAALNIVSKSGETLETLVNAALALEALKKAVPGEDAAAIRKAMDELQKSSHAMADVLYRQAQAAQQTTGPGSQAGSTSAGPGAGTPPGAGDVIDAEVVDEGKK
jgi:hypothetical protein